MSRIAVIGTGPLQEKGVRFFSGQCLRTWHFTRPLQDAGHEILLLTLPIHADDPNPGPGDLTTEAQYKGLRYWRFRTTDPGLLLPEIERVFAQFRPDGIFGINPFPASLACRQRYRAPVWADMNGYVPAEGQTHCALHDSDTSLEHFWQMEKEVVRRADRISIVSRIQGHATLGELAILGRLNRHTHATKLVSHIPNAVSERYTNFTPPPPHLRGRSIPANAFLTLWSGGFNTWTDIDTLHTALERVMEAHPDFYFAATGGTIAGHDEKTFLRFRRLVEDSPHRERYHLLGWVETQIVDALLGEANLGINIDSWNYETIFGARNRLTTMMACGLPVLTTRGTEISEEIDEAGVGLVVPIGDPEGLAAVLLEALRDRRRLKDLGSKARTWALDTYSYEHTTREAVTWAQHPTWAPDNQQRLRSDNPSLPLDRIPLHSLDELLIACNRDVLETLRTDQRDLQTIRQRPLWRALRALKSLLRRN